MFWAMSGSKNNEKRQKKMENGEDPGVDVEERRASSRPSFGRTVSKADGKDHFFTNLVPSFIKRDKS